MTDDSTSVDVLSLEDFHATLAHRLSEVDSVIAGMNRDLATAPAFGDFLDGKASAADFLSRREDYLARANRLRSAIVAAQTATATIIANYKSTEQRNHANAADIAGQLGGVGSALQDGASGG
jgi:hypothetical protein